jgi:hypothetical protein
MNLYYRFKLWYWWNYTIKCNEFHYKLGTPIPSHSSSSHYAKLLSARRDLAHYLDSGMSIWHVPIGLIRKAKL